MGIWKDIKDKDIDWPTPVNKSRKTNDKKLNDYRTSKQEEISC